NAGAEADGPEGPAQTEPLARCGVAVLLRTAAMVERSRRRALPQHVLPTLFDRRTRAGVQSWAQLHEQYADRAWPGAVPMDTRLRDAHALAREGEVGGRGYEAYGRALKWLLAQGDAAQRRAA